MKKFEEIIYPFNVAYIVFGDDHELDLGGEEAQALCNSEKFWDDYKRLLDTLTRDELRTVIDKLFRETKSFDETAKEMNVDREYIKDKLYPMAIRQLRHPARVRFWIKYVPRQTHRD